VGTGVAVLVAVDDALGVTVAITLAVAVADGTGVEVGDGLEVAVNVRDGLVVAFGVAVLLRGLDVAVGRAVGVRDAAGARDGEGAASVGVGSPWQPASRRTANDVKRRQARDAQRSANGATVPVAKLLTDAAKGGARRSGTPAVFGAGSGARWLPGPRQSRLLTGGHTMGRPEVPSRS